ncbi:MAG: hypothetical protein JXA22_00730 [Candidatus Thermoplasmatota archaeon]|nr:hypothetical protein [Candidatus Thermoplasmatota archaeon]
MLSKNEKLSSAGRNAVKKSLIEDGWMVLFENNNTEYPADIKAMKGADKILVHIMVNSESGGMDESVIDKLDSLKEMAEKSNSFAFKVNVEIDQNETLKDIRFSQLV